MDDFTPKFPFHYTRPRVICPQCKHGFIPWVKPQSEGDATRPSLRPANHSLPTGHFQDATNERNSISSGIQSNASPILRSSSHWLVPGNTFQKSQKSHPSVPEVSAGTVPRSSQPVWVYPAKFTPPAPTSTPLELFPNFTNRNHAPPISRFIHRMDLRACLVFVDGVYLDYDMVEPRGETVDLSENYQTNQRATLWAAIAALRHESWTVHGFETLVVVSSSDYVVEGATTWLKTLAEQGWIESHTTQVKHRDLWRIFFGLVQKWDSDGLTVKFWKVTREFNTVAHQEARLAAGAPAPAYAARALER
ncbi:hypothetical protein F5Y06DRAFT_292311 [Hypoxylon sp. FL0890]|nr:hypothetical protein F5Y06DRAFT_292311 [Hypoxylon sp. FL0890]